MSETTRPTSTDLDRWEHLCKDADEHNERLVLAPSQLLALVARVRELEALSISLSDRCQKQSDLLSRKAEKL